MKYIARLTVDNNIIIHGDECVTDLAQLYKALAQRDTTEIEITREYADKFFTYSALVDFVQHAAAVAPNVIISVQDTVTDNMMVAVKQLQTYRDKEALLYALMAKPDTVLSTIHALCRYYIDSHDEQTVANSKIATLLVQVGELRKQLDHSKRKQKELQDECNEAVAKLSALVSRTNFRYAKTVEPDELFLARHNNYNHILYIKEITRVHYVDSLVYYLQEIMRTMYSVPMRSVVIEPYYAYANLEMYPSYKPHWDLTYNDVYSGNIFMAGYQPKLMNDLLQNANRVNFMIILDRGGYSYPHVQGKNVTTVYTASDLKDVFADIDLEDVISYSDESMYIPYIEGFDDLSPEQKIQKYSSMPVMKNLIELLEA